MPAIVRLLLLGAALGTLSSASSAAPTARFDSFEYRGGDPAHEQAKAGPGDYLNPILSGFYPDPSITRAGDDFYLVTSTFAWFPGIPVFQSRDLVSWTQIGNAIDRQDMLDFGKLGLSRGVFAPSIEEHRGTFYILNTCVDCGGNFLITAANPAGPWSDPVWLPELEGGIDPSLFFDDDGRAWILNNGPPEGTPLYEGHRAIWIQEFDVAAQKTKGPRRVLVNGGVDISTKPIWIEGPHIFRKDGFYYLICAEGGTAEGHSQVVLRSKRVTGPYEPWSGNPILTQRDLPRDRPMPITSAGHADFVETAAGEWWATFLAVRPYQGDLYNTGRETFLMPVEWKDGWPRITDPGEAIPYAHRRPQLPRQPAQPTTGIFGTREEFDAGPLPPHWMMPRNPRESWHRIDGGSLVLDARPVALGERGNPSFIARRQQHINATATTTLRFAPAADGDEAGLAAFQSEDYWYFLGVGREGGKPVVKLERRAGPSEPAGGLTIASAPLPVSPGEPLHLRFEANGPVYRASYAAHENWQPLGGELDGTILSTKTAGGFVGAVFGLHAASATAGEQPSGIRMNQLGFLPDGAKRAMLPDASTTPLGWRLLDQWGVARAQGQTLVAGQDAPSGEHVHIVDFSAFGEAGSNYQLVVGEVQSRPFRIAPDIFAKLPSDALAYFYHNRASTPIEARLVGERWARPTAHAPDRATCFSGKDEDGNEWPGCGYTLDASRGWYDAGDQGKYVVNGGISVWTLLNLHEHLRAFPDRSAAIPEAGNGVSDLLDEARWELEFLLAMQVPEGTRMRLPMGQKKGGPSLKLTEVNASGMAHHKLADVKWTALPMPPHLDPERRYLYPPSTGATLNLAAVAAQCARIWRDIDAALADRCLQAAERAYAAAKRNPEVYFVGNFTGSGAYGDGDVSDEFYWAAAELYATTRKPEYERDFRSSPHFTASVSEPAWPRTAALGTITLAALPDPLRRADLHQAAERFLRERETVGYRIPYGGTRYAWGSSSDVLNRAIILAQVYDFTGDARFRDGVIDAMDYLLGRNPIDRSYVSGYGARPMAHPHHRFWAPSLDPKLPPPPPGALSGGPNNTNMSDPVASKLRGTCAPQACWADDVQAYALNEVAINWNAPLVWVSAWLAERSAPKAAPR